MSEHAEKEELKQYADGWMTERKGTDIPKFLKLAFLIIGPACTAYIVLQMFGDIHHESRGPFVEQFAKVSVTSPVFQYVVTALALVYVIIMLVFTFRTFKED